MKFFPVGFFCFFFWGKPKAQNWSYKSSFNWVNRKKGTISTSNIKCNMWHSSAKLCQGPADSEVKDISTASIYVTHFWNHKLFFQHPVSHVPEDYIYLYTVAFKSLLRCDSSTLCAKAFSTAYFTAIPIQMFIVDKHKSCILFKTLWKLQMPSYYFVKGRRISNPVFRTLGFVCVILFNNFFFISSNKTSSITLGYTTSNWGSNSGGKRDTYWILSTMSWGAVIFFYLFILEDLFW